MAQYIVLSDENCTGHATAIFHSLARLQLTDLIDVELLTWEQAGLLEGAKDEIVWRFCQQNRYLLLTGNRTAKHGVDSLEYTVRELATAMTLPILTIGDLERVLHDRNYCERCAERLAEILFELEAYRGVMRLYLT